MKLYLLCNPVLSEFPIIALLVAVHVGPPCEYMAAVRVGPPRPGKNNCRGQCVNWRGVQSKGGAVVKDVTQTIHRKIEVEGHIGSQ